MNQFVPVRGVEIAGVHLLRQGHDVCMYGDLWKVRANVSAENLDPLFRRAVAILPEPLCFILELPCHQSRELELRNSPDDPFHRDVYYIDYLSHDEALAVYDSYQELLVNDGMVYYGVGSQAGGEIFIGDYKLFTFYGLEYPPIEQLLSEFEIPKVEKLATARSTFSKTSPGRKSRIEVDGKSAYDMVDDLKKSTQIYFARTIEE